jgi:hypothetical protein
MYPESNEFRVESVSAPPDKLLIPSYLLIKIKKMETDMYPVSNEFRVEDGISVSAPLRRINFSSHLLC